MIFEFYWSWYEDYSPIILEGPEKTEEEFKNDCKRAMIESFDSYMSNIDGWASMSDWVPVASLKLEEYGYKILKPVHFGYFGFYLPKDKDIDNFNSTEVSEEMGYLKEQIERMIKHNELYDKEIEG